MTTKRLKKPVKKRSRSSKSHNLIIILTVLVYITVNIFVAREILLERRHEYQKNLSCLSQNIFFEARGASVDEKIRIANVTLNRTRNDNFPSNICAVVKQHKQFSWVNKVKPVSHYLRNPEEDMAWQDSVVIAKLGLAGILFDRTNGALFYHSVHIKKPIWARRMHYLVTTEYHKYYRYDPDRNR